jgi:hypothetical protein
VNQPHIRRETIWKCSNKQAPFCPDCGTELNFLDMINHTDTCKCGEWWEGSGGTYFRPNATIKKYTLVVNGVEQEL